MISEIFNTSDVVCLKLGGSLITNKNRPHTCRRKVLARLAEEIATARSENPRLTLILGHGSGSFGHQAAYQYQTHLGVHSPEDWLGFTKVWQAARALNQIVVERLCGAGLPVVAFPPSSLAITENGEILSWHLPPLKAALQSGLIPLVQGDVVFDTRLGGTILSTEKSLEYLAKKLGCHRILLAGMEKGVWADYPKRSELLSIIHPNFLRSASINGSSSVDVTGGMSEKVKSMLILAGEIKGFQAVIFSGMVPGSVYQALKGEHPGTLIRSSDEKGG